MEVSLDLCKHNTFPHMAARNIKLIMGKKDLVEIEYVSEQTLYQNIDLICMSDHYDKIYYIRKIEKLVIEDSEDELMCYSLNVHLARHGYKIPWPGCLTVWLSLVTTKGIDEYVDGILPSPVVCGPERLRQQPQEEEKEGIIPLGQVQMLMKSLDQTKVEQIEPLGERFAKSRAIDRGFGRSWCPWKDKKDIYNFSVEEKPSSDIKDKNWTSKLDFGTVTPLASDIPAAPHYGTSHSDTSRNHLIGQNPPQEQRPKIKVGTSITLVWIEEGQIPKCLARLGEFNTKLKFILFIFETHNE
ncbi:hypothetical protein Fmac_018412 [Flemingia macrophylla]|uniref:Uncharacterized protein n=1 Tax=Flemingia macrophylla TaxID=520843 RepID=A0ABD1M4Z3_9FABA